MTSRFRFRNGKSKNKLNKKSQSQFQEYTDDLNLNNFETSINTITVKHKKRSLIKKISGRKNHKKHDKFYLNMNQQQTTPTNVTSNQQQQTSSTTLAPIINTQQLTSLALNSLQTTMSNNLNITNNNNNNNNYQQLQVSTNPVNSNLNTNNINNNNSNLNNTSSPVLINNSNNNSQLPVPVLNSSISSNALSTSTITPTASSTKDSSSNSGTMCGYLSKWTNYLKGYQKRWFNLSNGLLSYYRSQTEMAHSCRGTINLANAVITSEDACHFVVSNGGAQVFHLKANSEMEKQKWVAALELAKNRARQDNPDSDEETNTEAEKNEVQTMLKTLSVKLEDLNTCHDLVQKHSGALTKSLIDLEGLQSKPDDSTLKTINERATLFKITLLAMINACQEFTTLANTQGKKMQKVLQSEHDMRIKLEEMVQEMARQQSNFETQVSKRSKQRKDGTQILSTSGQNISKDGQFQQQQQQELLQNQQQQQSQQSENTIKETHTFTKKTLFELNEDDDNLNNNNNNNDDEFHDALEDVCLITVPKSHNKLSHKRNPSNLSKFSLKESDVSSGDEEEQDNKTSTTIQVTMHSNKEQQQETEEDAQKLQQQQQQQKQLVPVKLRVRERRKEIPLRPNYSLNLWGIMKNCIGKDLSKIPIPVNFSEPISMLQRIIEELEYSELLDKASMCEDQWEQMAYVAAFTISAYSTTATRTNKPFNPILGETYECDRFDEVGFGWRAVGEQVSHHPPGMSVHCESIKDWILYQEFLMSSKFRGQYLQVVPLGTSHLEFKKTGHHYTWRKITTFVRNIIVGKLWIDNVGEMDIINHKTKDVCHLKYFPYSYFSREPPRKVTGIITDSNNVARYVLNGTWTEQIEGAPVLNPQVVTEQTQLNTGVSKILWKRKYPPSHLENMYNFTELAVQLNEPEDNVAPTDSRHRPDQRLMEQGLWDEANKEKVRLEEKQRTIRKQREALNEQLTNENKPTIQHEPLWFKKVIDPYTNQPIHLFKNDYWECKKKQDWKRCPDLF